MDKIKCSFKGFCCDKGEQGECLSSEDSACDKRVKPDQSRLLRDEEVSEQWHYFMGSENNTGSWHYLLKVLKGLRDRQDAMTASIKDAECQARIEALIEEVEAHEEHYAGVDSYGTVKIGHWKRGKPIYDKWWKAAKVKALKATYTSKEKEG